MCIRDRLSPAAFLKKHWRKCALAVHGGRQRFAALIRERLHGLSVAKLVADSPSEEIHVWFRTAAGNESMKTPDREAALTCHRAGGSLYFRAPADASELLVTALSQQLGLSFGALYPDGAPRGEVHPPKHTHTHTHTHTRTHTRTHTTIYPHPPPPPPPPPPPLPPPGGDLRLSSGSRDRLAL